MQKLLSRIRASLLREVSATASSIVEMQRGKGVRDATEVALRPVCQRGVCDAVATRLYPIFCAMSDCSLKGTMAEQAVITLRAPGGRSVDTGAVRFSEWLGKDQSLCEAEVSLCWCRGVAEVTARPPSVFGGQNGGCGCCRCGWRKLK